MQIKELARERGLRGPARHCGQPMGNRRAYGGIQGGRERESGILAEIDSYHWIIFLPMSDCGGACNRYFGRLNTGKMKIRE
jgi:hypothetical protein